MNLNKHSKVRAVGLSSSFALLALLGLAVFCPDTSEGANAADSSNATFELDFVLDRNNTRSQVTQAISQDVELFSNGISAQADGDITKTATFVVDFLLAPKLSISLDNLPATVSQTVQPTASGQTVSQSASFTATTNSSSGLGVFVYGTNGTDLVGAADANNKIPTLTANASGLSAIPVNHWGYNVTAATSAPAATNLTYKPLSASKGNAEDSTSSATTNQSYYITFGAKVDYNKAPDTYSNTVKVHVVPNATSTTAANEMGKEVDNVLKTQSENTTNGSETEVTE